MSVLIKLTDNEYNRIRAILKDKLKSISAQESDRYSVRDYLEKVGNIKGKTQLDIEIKNLNNEYVEINEILYNMAHCIKHGITVDTKPDPKSTVTITGSAKVCSYSENNWIPNG